MTNITDTVARDLTARLPTTVVPLHYQLYKDVSQLEQYVFQGIVDIDVKVN